MKLSESVKAIILATIKEYNEIPDYISCLSVGTETATEPKTRCGCSISAKCKLQNEETFCRDEECPHFEEHWERTVSWEIEYSLVGFKFPKGSKAIVRWYCDEYQNGGASWQREPFNHIESVELKVVS